jgi:hypothetical protein
MSNIHNKPSNDDDDDVIHEQKLHILLAFKWCVHELFTQLNTVMLLFTVV